LKKEIKHDCPENLVYSNKAGKCINPRLEDEESLNEYSEDPDSRNKSAKNLRFPATKGRVQGVQNE